MKKIESLKNDLELREINQYKKLIIEMIDKIDNADILRRMYIFITKIKG